MKKTISSSIGGIVFNVEEDAHAKLSAYLDAISVSIKSSEGHDEIMADIEARIAEILQQKMGSFKQVVMLAEVDEVIGIMGNPEDFGAPTDTKQQSYSSSGNRYSSWGSRRRLYRDTDDKVIFGVCSGLSHHFGVDPLWLRLAFGLSIFIGGFGLILYILLAIITPKARTTAEKLEMMGEPVDINNIRRSIEDEMDHLKKKVNDFGNDFRDSRPGDRAKEFGKDMGDFFSSVGHGVGNVAGGVIKAILMFFGFIITIVLAAVLIAFIFSLTSGVSVIHMEANDGHMVHYTLHNFFDMLSVTGGMRTILIIGILLFLSIPLAALIVRFGRAAAGRRQPFQWFTITASILWAAAWIFLIIGIAAVSSHFAVTDYKKNDVPLTSQSAKVLYIKMNDAELNENTIVLDSSKLYLSEENEISQNPSLCISQSPDSTYHLIVNKMARGINKSEAADFADAIAYNYSNHDSVLALNPYFNFELTRGWRKQGLDLILELPLNKSVAFPEGIDHILCYGLKHKHRGMHFGGSTWTMTATGLVPNAK